MIRVASRSRLFNHLTVKKLRPVIQWDWGSTDERSTFVASSSLVVPSASTVSTPFRTDKRFMSTESDKPQPVNDSAGNVDETLNRLFADSQHQLANATADGLQAAGEALWEPKWYNLADQAINTVNAFHDFTGFDYGWSIVGVTVILRLALFPVMVRTQRASSRMAHLQPELTQMKNRYEALGTPSRQDQVQFGHRMKALFDKYEVKPFQAFAAPLLQLPLFMGMFFGLKKMPALFPDEFRTGGMFWFTDLTATDPLYILPLASAGTFLALIEMGKEQMMAQNAQQGQLMINVFRVMSLGMIPVCINFEASMLVYWTANNILTMAQTATLKTTAVRNYFGIWDPPKPVPGQQPEGIMEAANKLIDRVQGKAVSEDEKIKRHNKTVDAKKRAFQMMKSAKPTNYGITGKRNA